jgi:Ni/Co efflux regulator RcnB
LVEPDPPTVLRKTCSQVQELKMRKLFIAALAASVALPGVASAQGMGEIRRGQEEVRAGDREVFRGGRYNAPRGYRYRPVSVGYTFRPAFYTSRYWVSNPARYRLNAPGRYQRWIRYGNDVILINTRNGRVLIIHRNFFW